MTVLHYHHMLFQAFPHYGPRREIATHSDHRSKFASKNHFAFSRDQIAGDHSLLKP